MEQKGGRHVRDRLRIYHGWWPLRGKLPSPIDTHPECLNGRPEPLYQVSVEPGYQDARSGTHASRTGRPMHEKPFEGVDRRAVRVGRPDGTRITSSGSATL